MREIESELTALEEFSFPATPLPNSPFNQPGDLRRFPSLPEYIQTLNSPEFCPEDILPPGSPLSFLNPLTPDLAQLEGIDFGSALLATPQLNPVPSIERNSGSNKRKSSPNSGSPPEINKNQTYKFKCDFQKCDKSFKQKCTLTRHKKIHTNEKPFCCDSCGRKFREKPNLNRHIKSHVKIAEKKKRKLSPNRTNKFTCDFPECTKSFEHNFTLIRHKKTHTNEKPFCCDFCSEAFRVKQQLQRHMLKWHDTETLMGQPVTKETIEAHLSSKSQKKPKIFHCGFPKCGKKYSNKRSLYRHEDTYHSNLNFPPEKISPMQIPSSASTVVSSSVETAVLTPSASNNELFNQTEPTRLIEISQLFTTGKIGNLPCDIGTPQFPVLEKKISTPAIQSEIRTVQTHPKPIHPGNLSESQSLSVTRAIKNIQNVLSMIPSVPSSTPEKLERQISSTTTSIRSLLLLMFSKLPLSLSPQQLHLQVSMITDLVRSMIFTMLSEPSSKEERNSQIDAAVDTIKNLVDDMVSTTPIISIKKEVIDLTPSDPALSDNLNSSHSNLESKRSTPLSDNEGPQLSKSSDIRTYTPKLSQTTSSNPFSLFGLDQSHRNRLNDMSVQNSSSELSH
jgi:hypothetical protein